MRRLAVSAVLFSILWVDAAGGNPFHAVHGAAKPKKPASRVAVKADGWPETPAAAVAKHWVQAFAAGDDAMRAFYAERLTRESLVKKGVAERLKGYHELRERFGTLTLASIDVSTSTKIEARLLTSEHRTVPFIFTVQATNPPRLVSVAYRDQRPHAH